MDENQKRLFLALLLCAGAAIVWQMFFLRPPMVPPGVATGTGSAVVATEGTSVTQPEVGQTTDGTGQLIAQPEDQITVASEPDIPVEEPVWLQGNSFRAAFSNLGGTLTQVQIQEPEQYIPRDEFGGVFPHGIQPHLPYGMTVSGLPALLEQTPFNFVPEQSQLVEDGDDDEAVYTRLVFQRTFGDLEITKTFEADPERAYVTHLTMTFRDLSGNGQVLGDVEVHVWTDDSGGEQGGMFNPIANELESACYVGDSLEDENRDDIIGQQFNLPTRWVSVQDRYFLTAAAMPENTSGLGCRFERDNTFIGSAIRIGGFQIGPNESQQIEIIVYTGPKDADDLEAAGSELSRSVSFGIFSFLAKPMRWLLRAFFSFIPNFGVAIILLTIVVKLLMFPWTHKSFKSMERMKEIQPKIQELREKYKNDKAKMTEATMKLYKEHNVNPLGCLPMLLQMPIYIALYRTIYSSVELYKADFALWITDLSQSDPYYVLPVLMTATMFGQQLLMPTAIDNPQMKWVMRLMPIMFGVFMLVLPSGLVLYIFVSSLLGIGQQYMIRRQRQAKTSEEEVPTSTKKTRQQRRRAARRD